MYIKLPGKDDDYLAKLIDLFGNICSYAQQNKKALAKYITWSALSAYSIHSIYNSGATFKKEPHYSLFLPTNKYIYKVCKEIQRTYDDRKEVETNQAKQFSKREKRQDEKEEKEKTEETDKRQLEEEHIIFQKACFENESATLGPGPVTKINTGTDTMRINNDNNIELYNIEYLIDFLSYLPEKVKREEQYQFSEAFINFKNIFKKVKITQNGNVLVFLGKLKMHIWILLPLKWRMVKVDNDTYKLLFIPLNKKYSRYIIDVEVKRDASTIMLTSKLRIGKLNDSVNNSFYVEVMKNVAAYLTYDIFQGINNNINILYKRKRHFNKLNFIRTKTGAKTKRAVTTKWSKGKTLFPNLQFINFKRKCT